MARNQPENQVTPRDAKQTKVCHWRLENLVLTEIGKRYAQFLSDDAAINMVGI